MWSLIKYVPVLIASAIIGNWFLKEVHKSQTKGEPWYAPYQTVPGAVIVTAVVLPIIFWLFFF